MVGAPIPNEDSSDSGIGAGRRIAEGRCVRAEVWFAVCEVNAISGDWLGRWGRRARISGVVPE